MFATVSASSPSSRITPWAGAGSAGADQHRVQGVGPPWAGAGSAGVDQHRVQEVGPPWAGAMLPVVYVDVAHAGPRVDSGLEGGNAQALDSFPERRRVHIKTCRIHT